MNVNKLLKGHRGSLLELFLKPLVESPLHDVRCLMQLPKGRLKAGCNLSAGILLLNMIAGISVCLYDANLKEFNSENKRRKRFKGLLSEYYPWENEPIEKEQATEILWSNARNPLTHSLGLLNAKRAESAVLFTKRALR